MSIKDLDRLIHKVNKGWTIRKVMGRVGPKQKKDSGKRKSREKIFQQLLAT